ncbi:YtpR family tRNA-binding protein [Bacillaceae bacterium W0354]
MQVVYNPKGIGDVLIVTFDQRDSKVTDEKFGDVVKLTDSVNGDVVGYNIFRISQYMNIDENEKVNIDENLIAKLEEIFKQNGLNDPLEVDLSPKFVVGYVMKKEKHEDASKLNVCQVDVGDEQLQIVCGAHNVDEGQKVVVAKIGAIMPSGLVIKPSELRGVKSNGMICSAKELNLPNALQEKGILVLDDHYEVGSAFL